MYTLLWFSPTGNTKYLAELLQKELPVESEQIELKKGRAQELRETENLVILHPIHGFNTPRTVEEYFKDFSNASPCKIWLVAVGCAQHWINLAATLNLQKILRKKGHRIMGDFRMAMPSTFIMAFPDDYSQGLIQQARNSLPAIAQKIIQGEEHLPSVPFKSKIVNFFGRAEKFGARFFGLELHANKGCTSCGLCWKNCPENNIRKGKKGRPRFAFHCLMCMKCIYQCPERAIKPYLSRFMTIKKGYNLKNYLEP